MPRSLSDDQVAQIRALAAEGGLTLGEIAERFGTSKQHVSRLVRGEQRSMLEAVDVDGSSVVAAVERALGEAGVAAVGVAAATALALAEKLDSVRASQTAQSAMAAPGLARALSDMLAELGLEADEPGPRLGGLRDEEAVLVARELGYPNPDQIAVDLFDELEVICLRRARRLAAVREAHQGNRSAAFLAANGRSEHQA